MSDLFPTPPPQTKYSQAFEKCWKQHSVGTKKSAYNAGIKAGWSDGNWAWLERYLEERHRLDAKWLEGTYIPHLTSIINGERWDDPYARVKVGRMTESREFKETHEDAMAKIAASNAQRGLH